jgi:hypothetical protein
VSGPVCIYCGDLQAYEYEQSCSECWNAMNHIGRFVGFERGRMYMRHELQAACVAVETCDPRVLGRYKVELVPVAELGADPSA